MLDQAGLATTMTASEYKQKPPHCSTYSLHNPKYPGALNIPCMRGRAAHDTLLVRTDPWVGLSSTGKARLYTASTIERGYGSSDARGIGAWANDPLMAVLPLPTSVLPSMWAPSSCCWRRAHGPYTSSGRRCCSRDLAHVTFAVPGSHNAACLARSCRSPIH